MKLRILSLSIRAMFRPLGVVAGPDYQVPQWPIFPVAWLYDLRAKAADDTADARGEQSAADLLGHTSVATTKRHYLRRGKIVGPTK